jgi:hypothetical protein
MAALPAIINPGLPTGGSLPSKLASAIKWIINILWPNLIDYKPVNNDVQAAFVQNRSPLSIGCSKLQDLSPSKQTYLVCFVAILNSVLLT